MADPAYTPTERTLVDALSDGRLHNRRKLATLLPDDMGGPRNLRFHIRNIRGKLPPDEQIDCVVRGRERYYRHSCALCSCRRQAVTA